MNYQLVKIIGRILFGENNLATAEEMIRYNGLLDTAISENNLKRELLILEQEKEVADLKARVEYLEAENRRLNTK